MKYGVIDVGSNSVRLMMSDGVKSLYKQVCTTRLAEGMNADNMLNEKAVERTVSAVSFFVDKAKEENADKIFIFATAAVRKAVNSYIFTDLVYNSCGIKVDVISGQKEALTGMIGALSYQDGAIIDVGGASTEISVVKGGNVLYSKSIDIGSVVLFNQCGQDYDKAKAFVASKILEFRGVPNCNFVGIGGTATSVASMLQELEPYDPEKVDGYFVGIENLSILLEKLYGMSVEERKKLKGLQPERAKVIAGGVLILHSVLSLLKKDGYTASERDNLEGYLTLKLEGKHE